MTYSLLIGDRSYSSWSLRGWLPFAVFGIPVKTQTTTLYSDHFFKDVAAFGGGRTVPVARTPLGGMLSDSLAIAWHLAEEFPDRGLLPSGPKDRATALSMIATMHAGFEALRGACPMNLRTAWVGFSPNDSVQLNLRNVDEIWSDALAGSSGPFLFGEYSLADVFFAPVATRIATYGLAVSSVSQGYVNAHLNQPDFRRWRAMGLAHGPEQKNYEMGLPRVRFPAPEPITARMVASGPSENDTCPYSGKPVADFAEIGGRIFGFCNPFCRDKTVADPAAWPKFMAIYNS